MTLPLQRDSTRGSRGSCKSGTGYPPMNDGNTTVSRAYRGRDHLDRLHHAFVLMLYDVAVEDEAAQDGRVGEGDDHGDLTRPAVLRRRRENVS